MKKIRKITRLQDLPDFWLHIIGWAVFITYELSFVTVTQGVHFDYTVAYYYTIYITFFYCNQYLLDFSFSRKRFKILTVIVLSILEIAVAMSIKLYVDVLLEHKQTYYQQWATATPRYLVLNVFREVYMWLLSLVYWSGNRAAKYRKRIIARDKETIELLQEKSALESNLNDTRFAYYQQQINPHFLFNTLNFIYNSVYKHSKEASNAVVLLSDIMRYSLNDMDVAGKITLDREVEQIENLIEINRLRYDYKLHIDLITDGDYDQVKFIPLILLTFVENVFKYGNLKDEQHPAVLRLAVSEGGRLTFETLNAKKQHNQTDASTGIGIENAKKRLEYAYGENFDLSFQENDSTYGLKLTVDL